MGKAVRSDRGEDASSGRRLNVLLSGAKRHNTLLRTPALLQTTLVWACAPSDNVDARRAVGHVNDGGDCLLSLVCLRMRVCMFVVCLLVLPASVRLHLCLVCLSVCIACRVQYVGRNVECTTV